MSAPPEASSTSGTGCAGGYIDGMGKGSEVSALCHLFLQEQRVQVPQVRQSSDAPHIMNEGLSLVLVDLRSTR
jgi:hypothetical protein